MKGSLIVVAFFVLGVLAGRSGGMPAWMLSSGTSFVALCALLLCVGISIGLNPDMKSEIKMGAMAAFFLMSNDVCSLLHHRQLTDCLAVDSGFAYYSLSSIFITEYRGAELGTIALLANIIREMITLLLTPLLAKWFGPLAPISTALFYGGFL